MKREWKTSTVCPACGHRLTLIDGIKAPTPFVIRCSGCRKSLRVHFRWTIPLLMGIVLLFFPSFALVPPIASRFGVGAAVLYGFWLLLGCLAAELGYGTLLYTFARFTVLGQRAAAATPMGVAATAPVSETPATSEVTGTGHWWTRYDARGEEQETRVTDGRP